MGFWTGFDYYYPGPAPRVTGAELAAVVRQLAGTGVLDKGLLSVEAVLADQNFRPISPALESMLDPLYRPRPLPDPDPGYQVLNAATLRARRWDRRLIRFVSRPFQPKPVWPDWRKLPVHERPTLPELADFLDSLEETPLLHAHVSLGSVPRETAIRLDVKSSENTCTACPYAVSLFLTSAWSTCMLGSDREYFVGQLGLSISGPGYCFPRKPREIIDDIRTDPGVTPLLRVLEEAWPTEVRQIEHARDVLSGVLEPDLWPYDDVRQPTSPEWLWGVHET